MLDRAQVRTILFDLDGTLMDTDDQVAERLAHRLGRLHLPHPRRAARRFVMFLETPGNALMTLVDALGLDGPLMKLTGKLHSWRGLRSQADFRIVSGTNEMLTQLSQRYRLAVVTSRGQRDAEAFLDKHDLRDLFDAVVTRESTWRLKPHPSPIQLSARLLDVPVEQCLMVGDTAMDVRAARRAGAWAVGVLCGFGEREELEQAGAHAILECTPDLAALLLA